MEDLIRRRYEEGWSIEILAIAFKLTETTIRKIVGEKPLV